MHVEKRSIYSTPPVFAIFAVRELTRWLLEDIGGLAAMETVNRRKAEILYAILDESDGYYRPRADAADRSIMNVVRRPLCGSGCRSKSPVGSSPVE